MSGAAEKRSLLQTRAVCAFMLFLLLNLIIFVVAPDQQKVCDQRAIRLSKSETLQQGKWTWWITRSYLLRHRAPDIALMGSSQMGAATFSADADTLNSTLDCVTHRRVATLEKDLADRTGNNVDVFDFAMGGGMVSDAYMYSKALFQGQLKPRMILIGVSPRDFMDNTLPSPSATETFAFFTPYVQLDALKQQSFADPFERLNFSLQHELPIRRVTALVQQYSDDYKASAAQTKTVMEPPHKIHNQPLQAILGSADEVRPGEWLIPPKVSPWLFEDNTKEYLRRYNTPKPALFEKEKAFFSAFLANAQEQHIPVLVVGMPSLIANRSLLPASFWQEFRNTMAAACRDHNAKFVDISDSPDFQVEDYLDTVHLNSRGGHKLFEKIAAAIVADPKLSRVVNAGGNQRFAEKVGLNAGNGRWQ